ncbi:ribosome small subunit-dependent GTPase A [Schlesneria sp.]|uniref:ribosome small subunit-dependent GTPase A n=1 Tax=Schlesneria sp. TaxID=2762018 RepID=UPI003F8162B8
MAKKISKKVRVDFRKNRQNSARQNDFTRQIHADESVIEDIDREQRVSGKGALTRRRTILGEQGEGDHVVLAVDQAACLRGRVISAIGSTQCTVQVDEGQEGSGTRFECTVRRVVRTVARNARNAVVTGDRVLFLPGKNQCGVIERVEPRQGIIARGHQYKQHILVANVSQVAIISSADEPPLKPALIDRFVVSAAKGEVRAIIVINKCDLVDVADLQPMIGHYAQVGYTVVAASVPSGLGIAWLRRLLKHQQTVFTGQSGVGKSSLLNAIQPGLSMKTGDISRVTQKGRHTTRFAQLQELSFGGWVVDTPGIRQLELWDVHPGEMEGYFIEFRPFVPSCKFPDCLHLVEEGCAVREAVKQDLISQIRYESYIRLVIGDD